ncbi:hypothetical protein [Duganella violaceipulchra]|uniref:Uncharacterized protein n=1 Tax=Duganella violaceipulchra TaxID=2849652 RepID=A0AA41KZI5_9BURK|nr:hypothetical protein [Duganella violaceicalia]MBV6320546.1 hypothetical protein [Duganella violaceicalia]MCP2008746.1 hypothetical protein [Duganella violaceicalia]
MHKIQTTELRQAASDFSVSYGENLSALVEVNTDLLIHWLKYLNSFHRTNVADSLLDGVACSIREGAGVLSLGLMRQALFSLRGQVDLMLAWLYFKDHEVEWSHVNDTADGFKLKKDILMYLEQNFNKFGHRMAILRLIKTRKELDPYRLLSAHVHAQSDPVLPNVSELKELIQSENLCRECATVAFEVSEFLNDILLSIYLNNWASLPVEIRNRVESRFKTPEQKKTFFS